MENENPFREGLGTSVAWSRPRAWEKMCCWCVKFGMKTEFTPRTLWLCSHEGKWGWAGEGSWQEIPDFNSAGTWSKFHLFCSSLKPSYMKNKRPILFSFYPHFHHLWWSDPGIQSRESRVSALCRHFVRWPPGLVHSSLTFLPHDPLGSLLRGWVT